MAVILNVVGYYPPGSKSLSITCEVYPGLAKGSYSCTTLILFNNFRNLIIDSLALNYCNLTFASLK